jgi:hypothetical protein
MSTEKQRGASFGSFHLWGKALLLRICDPWGTVSVFSTVHLEAQTGRFKKQWPKSQALSVSTAWSRCTTMLCTLPKHCLLVAGGPMPSGKPQTFLPAFDLVMRGEGELLWAELLTRLRTKQPYDHLEGICTLDAEGNLKGLAKSPLIPKDRLTEMPMPARDIFDHANYQAYWQRTFGYAQTPVFTARGCPYILLNK